MNLAHKLDLPVFRVIADTAKKQGVEAFVIGGFVRDLLLERPSKDIDFVVIGNGIHLASEVAKNLKQEHSLSVFKKLKVSIMVPCCFCY